MTKYLRPLVSIAILGWLAWRADWSQVGESFSHIRLDLWCVAFGLYLITQVASALRWQVLARALGFQQPLPHFIRLYFIGMFFNLFLPTSVGGDVARAWYLNARSGRGLTAAVSVFVDRVSGLLLLLALAVAGSLASSIDLPGWIPACVWGAAACAALGIVTLPLLSRMLDRFDRLQRLVEGIRHFAHRPRLVLETSVLSLLVQGANVIVLWILGIAIAAPVPLGYYWILVPMISLLTLLPISLNGMGIREGGMVLFLAPLGISPAVAMSMAFLWFSIFTAASVVGAGIYLFGSLPRPEGQSHDEPISRDSDQGRTGQLKAAA
jgi:glycosyltransferase 2 family protein